MIITRAGIEKMVLAISSHKDYGSRGHDDVHRDQDLVRDLSQIAQDMPANMHVPDHLLPFIKGSLLDHVIRGHGRPLGYLCSDCRYPKWLLTPAEVMEFYGHVESYRKAAERTGRRDGFTEITPACPECGD